MGKLVCLNTSAINYSTWSFWFSLLSWLVPPLPPSSPTPTVQLPQLRPPRSLLPKLPTLPPRVCMPPMLTPTVTTEDTPMLMVHGPVTTVMPVTLMPIQELNLFMALSLTVFPWPLPLVLPTMPTTLVSLPTPTVPLS